MTVPFVVAIPARLGSTRLPRKPLRLLAGRPLVVHVVERARVAGALEVVVATDSPEIADVVAPLGVGLAMTRADHPSGTDRLAEVATQRGWADDTVVVNLQGDEPFAPASGIVAVAATLAADPGVPMATLATPVASAEQLFDANAVKVVRDARGRALYCAAFLRQFTRLPRGLLEDAEALEQLRVLEAGHGIAVGIAPEPFPPGVDTEADLARAEAAMTALGAARQAP